MAAISLIQTTHEHNPPTHHAPFPPCKKIVTIWDKSIGQRTETAQPAKLVATCIKHMLLTENFSVEVLKQFPVNTPPDHQMDCCIYHPGERFKNNACWDSLEQAVIYGEVDDPDLIPDAFIRSLTTAAHEFGHAFLQYHSREGLVRHSQSGAIDESFADIFAIMVKHFQKGIVRIDDFTDWRIAAGIYKNDPEKPLRDLSSPVIYHANIYDHRDVDGTIYNNSGIPSRAFVMAAHTIGQPIWKVIGPIWVAAIGKVESNETLADFAQKTIQEAERLFDEAIAKAISDAWDVVGITPGVETIEKTNDI